ncbi:MAG: DUF2490 domain-containing protein [Bacteroidetes bacterium]|nr:MAG: DUF2490 domain-containing protein [Bacteroidota bacterium]
MPSVFNSFSMRRSGLLVGFLLLVSVLWAQTPLRNVTEEEQTWTAWFLQVKFNKHWGLWSDVHARRTGDFLDKWSQVIIRPGITYYITPQIRATAGYAYIHHFPTQGHLYVAQPEHRSWQQIQWYANYPGLRTMQWLRLEQRFRHNILDDYTLAEGYRYNQRLRYNFALFVPFTKRKFEKGGLFAVLNDEIHMNPDKNTANFFDQNRAFAGLGIQIAKHAHLQVGYMNVYQQRGAGNAYTSNHILRVFLFQTLDFQSPHK